MKAKEQWIEETLGSLKESREPKQSSWWVWIGSIPDRTDIVSISKRSCLLAGCSSAGPDSYHEYCGILPTITGHQFQPRMPQKSWPMITLPTLIPLKSDKMRTLHRFYKLWSPSWCLPNDHLTFFWLVRPDHSPSMVPKESMEPLVRGLELSSTQKNILNRPETPILTQLYLLRMEDRRLHERFFDALFPAFRYSDSWAALRSTIWSGRDGIANLYLLSGKLQSFRPGSKIKIQGRYSVERWNKPCHLLPRHHYLRLRHPARGEHKVITQ